MSSDIASSRVNYIGRKLSASFHIKPTKNKHDLKAYRQIFKKRCFEKYCSCEYANIQLNRVHHDGLFRKSGN